MTASRGEGPSEEPSAGPPTRRIAVTPSFSGRYRASGAFSALRYRNFRFFFYGQLVSLAGTWMQRVALSWLPPPVPAPPLYVGVVNPLDASPVLLLALSAGVVGARVSRHKLIITTQVTAM